VVALYQHSLAYYMHFYKAVHGDRSLEPTLMVIGMSHRSAPVDLRERYWFSESRRSEVLGELSKAEGIDEVIVLATCNRTEFILWADEVTLAANSVMRMLAADFGLKLDEWMRFYRLLDEGALTHIFRVICSVDSQLLSEPQITSQFKEAWAQAQKIGASDRCLDAVMQKALTVEKRVRSETIGNCAVPVPYAVAELVRQALGTLKDKQVLVIGAGKMGELSARGLLEQGAGPIKVMSRTLEHAAELAGKLGGVAIGFEHRWEHMAQADIIISSTSCPHRILSREEAQHIASQRDGRPLLIVDVAMPRDIDPEVRHVKGVFLYSLDDLEKLVSSKAGERTNASTEAEKVMHSEAQDFRRNLAAQRVVPTIIALRTRLDEICRQELESFRQENGPFTQDQDEMLTAVMARMTQRITGSLARELKNFPEQMEQEQMAAIVQRLFHLQTPERATAGTIL
jgi:glutamyl-tRNA reductase